MTRSQTESNPIINVFSLNWLDWIQSTDYSSLITKPRLWTQSNWNEPRFSNLEVVKREFDSFDMSSLLTTSRWPVQKFSSWLAKTTRRKRWMIIKKKIKDSFKLFNLCLKIHSYILISTENLRSVGPNSNIIYLKTIKTNISRYPIFFIYWE